MKHIVSFSGGKDSTAMLLMMIEKGFKIDRIINIDTTYEFPEMYRHIEKVKDYIKEYGLKIETVKIDFDYWFYKHIKTKGKNKGKKGYSWPDFRNRWCTALKRDAFIRTVCSNETFNPRKRGMGKKDKNIVEYHWISFDEKESRINKNKDGRNIKHPLIEWEMVGKDCIEYCYSKGFDWEGLYEKFNRVSCWCCPLQRLGELKIIYNEYPELWEWIFWLDSRSERRFRSDYSVNDLELKFKKELKC